MKMWCWSGDMALPPFATQIKLWQQTAYNTLIDTDREFPRTMRFSSNARSFIWQCKAMQLHLEVLPVPMSMKQSIFWPWLPFGKNEYCTATSGKATWSETCNALVYEITLPRPRKFKSITLQSSWESDNWEFSYHALSREIFNMIEKL